MLACSFVLLWEHEQGLDRSIRLAAHFGPLAAFTMPCGLRQMVSSDVLLGFSQNATRRHRDMTQDCKVVDGVMAHQPLSCEPASAQNDHMHRHLGQWYKTSRRTYVLRSLIAIQATGRRGVQRQNAAKGAASIQLDGRTFTWRGGVGAAAQHSARRRTA